MLNGKLQFTGNAASLEVAFTKAPVCTVAPVAIERFEIGEGPPVVEGGMWLIPPPIAVWLQVNAGQSAGAPFLMHDALTFAESGMVNAGPWLTN